MSRWLVVFAPLILLLASHASADMGGVYYASEGAKVSESAQKAIILHNFREEVLILGTELRANRNTPVIRFIPFPSEPKVTVAPNAAFERLAHILVERRLQFLTRYVTKGGAASPQGEGVEVRLSATLGAHDVTVIKVKDVAAFRSWVNDFLRSRHLPVSDEYPREEAIVADYVARGIDFFVLDFVEVPTDTRLVEPLLFRFASTDLYYPLKTSNSFGGAGSIELFIIAPTTLCAPGSGYVNFGFSHALTPDGRDAGICLKIANERGVVREDRSIKASTSTMLMPQDSDLLAILPDAESFFGQPVFLQAIRYAGPYNFDNDIMVPVSGLLRALTEDDLDEGSPDLDALAGQPIRRPGLWVWKWENWLAGTNWQFVELMGQPVPGDTRASIAFDNDGQSASGSGGCNRFSSSHVFGAERNQTALSFSDIGWTKMFCPGPGPEMQVEIGVDSVFGKTRSYLVLEGKLLLLGANGDVLARLVPALKG